MREDRILRVLKPSLALAALAVALVFLGLAIAGPAHAGTKSPTPAATRSAKPAKSAKPSKSATPSPLSTGAIVLQRGSEVRFGEDVVVPKGTTHTPLARLMPEIYKQVALREKGFFYRKRPNVISVKFFDDPGKVGTVQGMT